MQFLIISSLLATVALGEVLTETEKHTTVATITSCGPEVTDCPAHVSSSAASNSTIIEVSTFEAGANKAQFGVAGLIAAGALLAL